MSEVFKELIRLYLKERKERGRQTGFRVCLNEMLAQTKINLSLTFNFPLIFKEQLVFVYVYIKTEKCFSLE